MGESAIPPLVLYTRRPFLLATQSGQCISHLLHWVPGVGTAHLRLFYGLVQSLPDNTDTIGVWDDTIPGFAINRKTGKPWEVPTDSVFRFTPSNPNSLLPR